MTTARSVCLPFAPPRAPGRRVEPGRAAATVAIGFLPSKNATERIAAVEPASTISGVAAGTHSRISGVEPGHRRPVDDADRAARERGVRQQLVADGVDVLRLLEVGGGRLQLPLAGLQRRRLAGSGKSAIPLAGS